MNRRLYFKKIILNIGYMVCCILLLFPVISFIIFRKKNKKKIIFHPEEQLEGINIKDEILLFKDNNNLTAFLLKYPHLGCILNVDQNGKMFICPCHGSLFNFNGEYLSAPAKKDLKKLKHKIKSNNDIIVRIDL